MPVERASMRVRGLLPVGIVGAMLSLSCGSGGSVGGSGTPTAPTPVINLQIGSIVASVERTTDGLRYNVRFQLRETSGTMGATIEGVALDFSAQGTALIRVTTANPFSPMQIAAGGSLNSREFAVNHPGATRVPDQVNVLVDYTSDRGGRSQVTGRGSVTAPGTADPAPPSGAFSGGYGSTLTAIACSEASRRDPRDGTGVQVNFTVSASGTAGVAAVGGTVEFGTWPGVSARLDCGSWTAEVSNDVLNDFARCRRRAGQPETTTWAGAFANYTVNARDLPIRTQVGVATYDPTGGRRSLRNEQVICR